ncbi:MAG: hypothetical protein QXF26_05695, partial [Candidatus Bathyarchaeia archaeon]
RFRYNARQLFEGVRSWRYMASIKTDVEELKNQIAIFQASTSVASVVAVVLAVWLYIERRKR